MNKKKLFLFISSLQYYNIYTRKRNVIDGKTGLTTVFWYMNNILLYKLPNCDSSDKDMCSVDPTTLLLENVNKHFHGNFSCIGALSSGLSSLMSNTVALHVHYPPGTLKLILNSINFP